ncbi:hypothetical protein [Crassaminicella profunda]|uniref:hypothetical protein n=1 Tax=Crassaminicella profunda TaxID=1286698 RepID=UPI001CA6A5B7|nr:hypothetical protein [Crassaminicella profunda]QZY54343.1 hypothetical protein K7H06_15020 [Crassaminicella profunda]
MEELNREELSLKESEAEVLDAKDLEELNKKSNKSLTEMISNLFSNDKILPILLYALINRQEKKTTKAYWGDQLKDVVGKAENVLDILYALDEYTKDEYRADSTYTQNRPIELLEVIRPHVHGSGRQKIDQALAVNDRVSQLQENTGKNIIETFENITDILEILEIKKGSEMKRTLNKAKAIIEIMRR